MGVREDIVANFESFNIFSSEEVISKCVELCSKYDLDAEDLVDQWFAYSSSILRGAAPTLEYLNAMERKELMKGKDDRRKPSSKIIVPEELISTSSARCISPERSTNEPTFSDVSGTPKTNRALSSQAKTPLQNRKLQTETSDITSSPSTPLQTYSKRTDARTVRCTFGPTNSKFLRTSDIDIKVQPLSDHFLKYSRPIMYEVLHLKHLHINDMIKDLFHAIKRKYPSVISDESKEETYGDNVMLYGRVLSEAEGKLNSHSILLERSSKFNGKTVALKLNNVAQYSLFPGQVVVVKGTCLFASKGADKRDIFLVKELYVDANLDFPLERPALTDNLQLVIACGPFTVQENLFFEPLNDLLTYVKEHKPHVLLLTGPFYEITHQGILSGNLKTSYNSLFADLIDTIMGQVPTETQVILVSSLREPHHFPVYPTPPYQTQHYPNLTLLPDPCMVSVNGVVIGATTADIVFDIGSQEIHLNKTATGAPDRIGRLISHLFNQKRFYPLDPPGKQMYIDAGLMEEYGGMTCKPHVLVLPSNLRHFVKNVNGCLVINPERLTKGNGGGCFARLSISADPTNPSICSSSSCEVLRI